MRLTIDELFTKGHTIQARPPCRPFRSDHIGVGSMCATVSQQVWLHAQRLLLGEMLARGARTDAANATTRRDGVRNLSTKLPEEIVRYSDK